MTDELPIIVTEAVPGPRSLDLADRLAAVESPDTTFLSDDFPVFWESASGSIVRDVDGNTFLDATSSFGALSVGHTHPAVSEAIRSQAQSLIHGMGDVHPSRVKVELLERICRHVPIPDARVILGQSGADAVEAALKTSLLATGNPGVIAFDGGYHGLSFGALEPTSRALFRAPFAMQRGRFCRHLPFGCPVSEVADAIMRSDMPIGAVIAEPVQGRGGVRLAPDGWLREVSAVCAERGVLLIADEIYTGWGRTGSLFACDRDAVQPDLLCIGKAMGGGMPISACVGSRELIERAWPKSSGEAVHTSTFLGHPVACAAAIAAIDVIVGSRLTGRARTLGGLFLSRLSAVAADFPDSIAEVRGRGLMIGIQMRTALAAHRCLIESLRRGLLLLTAGDDGSVLELTPPLIISERQVEWCIETLRDAIAAADSDARTLSSGFVPNG